MLNRIVGPLFLLSVAGCTSWSPHSLVASNKPIREAVFTSKRVEAEVCSLFVLGFGVGDGRESIDELMEELRDRAPQAVAFQDIRFDEVLRWYVVFWRRCLHGSAEPVLRIPIQKPEGEGGAAAPQQAPAPGGGASDATKTPEELEQELLGNPSKQK